MSLYRVTGTRSYREHAPGSTFEAELDPATEHRAIARGSITLLRKRRVKLDKRKVRAPKTD